MGVKKLKCSSCGKIKTVSDFRKNRRQCNLCCGKRQLNWQHKNKDYVNSKQRERYHKNKKKESVRKRKVSLKRLYNLTTNDWDDLFNKQKGRCAICGKHQSELNYTINTDHNHLTKKVRGLLCINCNRGIGNFKVDTDNIKFLHATIDYIKSTDLSGKEQAK